MNNFTLYLSKEGDSVEIKQFHKNVASIPEQLEASACKTHQEVLAFLEKLSNSEVKDQIHFYHHHNLHYQGHKGTGIKGVAHQCNLEKQIDFVRYKIGEVRHGIRNTPLLHCVIL